MKLRRLRLSPELLADFLINPVPPGISSDAPADLKILNCQWADGMLGADFGVIELLVSSATFNDPADILEPVPLWDMRFYRGRQ